MAMGIESEDEKRLQLKRILVVEDEQRLAMILKEGLSEQGYWVDVAGDGYLGKTMAQKERYDLMILDLNLPIINGYDICREIRAQNNQMPIIMLTAMSSTENKLAGFDTGADDYIVKPFDFNELLARIRVFLRRSQTFEKLTEHQICIGDLIVNKTDKTVFRAGKQIHLTAKEFILLEYLAENTGRVVSRAEIASNIWNLSFDTGTNYIDVYINYLRKKIDANATEKLIHTRVGFGYILKSSND
jgi:two-component system, OmpR family, copper resistance phosphate regulon response regulator CusR